MPAAQPRCDAPEIIIVTHPKVMNGWKRHVWKSHTVVRLMRESVNMIELQPKSLTQKSLIVHKVHKSLLCFYSPYHDRLLNGSFIETTASGTIHVSLSSYCLDLFSTWLYTGQVQLKQDSNDLKHLVNLYIFACSVNSIALQRSVMSKIQQAIREGQEVASYTDIATLVGSALENSALYRYFVDTYAYHWNPVLSPDPSESPPGDFTFHVLIRKHELSTASRCGCCYDACHYHDHESEEERRATCGLLDDIFETEGNDSNQPDAQTDDSKLFDTINKVNTLP